VLGLVVLMLVVVVLGLVLGLVLMLVRVLLELLHAVLAILGVLLDRLGLGLQRVGPGLEQPRLVLHLARLREDVADAGHHLLVPTALEPFGLILHLVGAILETLGLLLETLGLADDLVLLALVLAVQRIQLAQRVTQRLHLLVLALGADAILHGLRHRRLVRGRPDLHAALRIDHPDERREDALLRGRAVDRDLGVAGAHEHRDVVAHHQRGEVLELALAHLVWADDRLAVALAGAADARAVAAGDHQGRLARGRDGDAARPRRAERVELVIAVALGRPHPRPRAGRGGRRADALVHLLLDELHQLPDLLLQPLDPPLERAVVVVAAPHEGLERVAGRAALHEHRVGRERGGRGGRGLRRPHREAQRLRRLRRLDRLRRLLALGRAGEHGGHEPAGRGHQADERQPGERVLRGDVLSHDHRDSPGKSFGANGRDAEAHDRNGPMGLARVSLGLEQRRRVRATGGWHEGGDPRVAAEVGLLAEPPANPPRHGMPPVQARDEHAEPAHPVVAATQVGELVMDDGVATDVVELIPQAPGQDEAGVAAAPDHRRDRLVDHAGARGGREPERRRGVGDAAHRVGRRRRGAPHEVAQTKRAERDEQGEEGGAAGPERGGDRRQADDGVAHRAQRRKPLGEERRDRRRRRVVRRRRRAGGRRSRLRAAPTAARSRVGDRSVVAWRLGSGNGTAGATRRRGSKRRSRAVRERCREGGFDGGVRGARAGARGRAGRGDEGGRRGARGGGRQVDEVRRRDLVGGGDGGRRGLARRLGRHR
jgi:hypothetical protein